MMAYSEDDIALAAEYALGTLDADERMQAEMMMSADKDFTAMVAVWEQKLAALNQMVGSVEPRPVVWDNIKTAIGLSGPQGPIVLPQAPTPVVAGVVTGAGAAVEAPMSSRCRYAFGACAVSRPLRVRWRRHCSSCSRLRCSSRICFPGHSAPAADASGRGKDACNSRPIRAICRLAAKGWRFAGVHSHGGWGDPELYRAQGRCHGRRSRQELSNCG